MSVYENLPARPPLQRCWQGTIADNPTDFADRVSIIIPEMDATIRLENCRWQARNSIDLPQRGDDCLAMLDNNNEWWVVVWWPF